MIGTVLNGSNTPEEYDTIRKRLDNSRRLNRIFFADGVLIESLGDVIHQLFFTGDTKCTFSKNIHREKYKQRTGILRSMEDTYILASYYLPGIAVEQVVAAINNFKVRDFTTTGLIRTYCSTVRRYVHRPCPGLNNKGMYTKYQVNEILDRGALNYKVQQDVLQEVIAE